MFIFFVSTVNIVEPIYQLNRLTLCTAGFQNKPPKDQYQHFKGYA
jgi:hypothetical protein